MHILKHWSGGRYQPLKIEAKTSSEIKFLNKRVEFEVICCRFPFDITKTFRVTVGKDTTVDDVNAFLATLPNIISKERKL